ncbi:MAG: sigma-54-dependent Fis family transcriptional regulator [Deltaproteobacteria bacterium]|nr:sigma-54-dependent Fis family transcriptional regulator [Deltaproteobacteria bacterium]
MSNSYSVLLVDDDKNIRQTLSLSLKENGFEVSSAASVDEAIQLLKTQTFDWMLTDFRLGEKTGLDLIQKAKILTPALLMVVMTAYSSIENAITVIKEGAFDYLPKPFTQAHLQHLTQKIRSFLELKKENESLKQESLKRDYFSGFTSPASTRLEEFIRKLAPSDCTILLLGESGTGKSELAKLIHHYSPRAHKPFVTVYCTTLTESLVESELFGHKKGSFTGALQDKKGKFEIASEGTLFLDEIGDLSPNAQAKLLRFLQDKVFEAVGSNEEIKVDTRVLVATNKDLAEEVSQGKFREDLYYRLNIFESHLVPLRYRMEDLPVFIEHFFEEFKKRGILKDKPLLSAEILKAFQDYSWPGNIRELHNVLERLVILSAQRKIKMEDLPDALLKKKVENKKQEHGLISLEQLDRRHIEYILSQESNLEKAAEILGITPVTLWRKRKEYGLN